MTETPGVGAAVGADINVNLIAALGGVTEQIKRLRAENAEERRQAAYARIKNYLPFTQTCTVDASGNGFIDFGTPMLGRQWTLRNVASSVEGFELAAPAASFIAGWYIGVPFNGDTTRITSQWRFTQYNPPVVTTFTSDIHQLRMGEHLFALVTGGTTGNVIVANVVMLDEPMKVGVPTTSQG